MKKILTIISLWLLPTIALANIGVGWQATSKTSGNIFPNPINGIYQSITAPYFTATSTTAQSTFAGIQTTNSTTSQFGATPGQTYINTFNPVLGSSTRLYNLAANAGYFFYVNTPITVYQLGRYYGSTDTQNHEASIWQGGVTTAPLASTSILVATTSDSDGYKWGNITPLVLSPGIQYFIGTVEYSPGDSWKSDWEPMFSSTNWEGNNTPGIYYNRLNPIFSMVDRAYYGGSVDAYPNFVYSGTQIYTENALHFIANNSIISTTSAVSIFGTSTVANKFSFSVGNTGVNSAFNIRNDGNVGIGTTTPNSVLSVVGTTTLSLLDPTSYINKRFIVEGDSLNTNYMNTGIPVGTNPTWPNYMQTYLGNGTFGQMSIYNWAQPGDTAASMVTEYSTQAHTNAPTRQNDIAYFSLWAGTNDIAGGTSATTVYGNLKTIWALARADGYKIIAFTIMPNAANSGPADTQRIALNQLIISNPSLYDYLIRPDLIFPNDTDSTYFHVDGTHLLAGGYQILGSIVANTLSYSPLMRVYMASATSTLATSTISQTTFLASSTLILNNGGLNVGIGTTSPSNLLEVAGNGYFAGNLTGANITATGTLSVLGNTTVTNATTTSLAITNLTNTFLAVNANGSIVATTSPSGTNYWSLSGATTTNTVANVASTLGVFGSIQSTSTTATSTFAATTTFSQSVSIGSTTKPLVFNINSVGQIGISTSTQDSSLDVNGNIRFEGSSTVVTTSISGAIVGLGCDTATTSVDSTVSSSTVFLTTPQTYPGAGLFWQTWYSAPNTITTEVCSDVTVTPVASVYNVKMIK